MVTKEDKIKTAELIIKNGMCIGIHCVQCPLGDAGACCVLYGTFSDGTGRKMTAIKKWLEENKEVRMKYKVGDKVVPISKTVPGWESLERAITWRNCTNGFLYITAVGYGDGDYMCDTAPDTKDGDYYMEADLIPYVEKEEKMKYGDKVWVWDDDIHDKYERYFVARAECKYSFVVSHRPDATSDLGLWKHCVPYEKPVKEMTVAEVEKALGYPVKIVKE